MPKKFRRFDCPFCSRNLKVRSEQIHKKIFCPRCNTILLAELDGDQLTLSAAPEQTEIFGPPVHRDFIQAEISEADPTIQNESDLDDLPVAEEAYEDLPIEDLPVAEEAHSKAESWARQHSEIQSGFDDVCIRAGIGLLLIGIALLLIPWVRTLLSAASALPIDLTLIGFNVSILAAGMLAFAKRRKPKRMFGVMTGLAIPVTALALLTPTPPPIENKTVYIQYTNPPTSGFETDIEDDRPSEFVGVTGKSPTGNFVSPSEDEPKIAVSENRKPEQFSPNRTLSITPVDDGEKQQLSEFSINPAKDAKQTGPLVPLNSREHIKSSRPVAQIRAEFERAMGNWKLHPATASSSKTKSLNERSKSFKKSAVSRFQPREPAMRRDYRVTQAAGRNTVFGNAIYGQLPIHGIDVDGKGNAPELFVPIADGPEFDDTLAWDENFFLVGFNVNIEGAVLGVQGVFAPFENEQLNMEHQVVGPWYGRPPAGNKMQSVSSYGNPVYGVVVYRDKLDIVGLSLVVGF